MKKLLFLSLTLIATTAYALPVGNPADASLLYEGICLGYADPCDGCSSWLNAINFRFGFYGDYVFNRHMFGGMMGETMQIRTTRLNTNAAYLALNLNNRFDIFSTLGASNFSVQTPIPNFAEIKLFTKTAFSWSIGGRCTLVELGGTALGIEAQYFQFRPELSRINIADTLSVYFTNDFATYREAQVGLGLSHRFDFFAPYVAVKYSRARFRFSSDVTGSNTLRNKKRWGYAVGATIIGCERVSVTAEGRFADELAFHCNAQVRF